MATRRWLVAGMVAVAAAVVLGLSALRRGWQGEGGSDLREKANLVLITIDTLRADHLGAYGYARATSPQIDRLAAEGTLFEQAGVQWPKTNPSMASMMSSTYCLTNGVRRYGAPVDPKLTTLAGILSREGYYCASFVANAHLGRFFNFDRGFDEVHELWAERDHAHPLSLNRAGTYDNDRIAELVSDWIGRHRERRFFLWLHLLDPHGPYEPPEALKARYLGDDIYESQDLGVPLAYVPYYQRRAGMAMVSDYVARYDGEVAYSDRVVGRVAAELETRGLRSDTLLVVTADHGESLGEHDYYFDHGRYLYEACLRVPLVFWRPGRIPANRRIDTPVGLIDLLPTLLELLDIDPSSYQAGFQGESLGPLIRGEPLAERAVFSEGNSGQVSIRKGKWKLIDDPRPDPRTRRIGLRLYDLSRDPREAENLVDQVPRVRDELHAELQSWKEKMMETIGRYEPQRIDPELLSEDMREFLRQRGWLSTGGPPAGSPEGAVKTLTPEEMEAVKRQLEALGYALPSSRDGRAEAPGDQGTATQPSRAPEAETDG